MARPTSALEHTPSDFIREVSLHALNFYADELSGVYLPEDFRQAHGEVFDVKFWESEKRLRGKFGRFALRHAQEQDGQAELDGILVMGTTIGLSGLDPDGCLASLRHHSLQYRIQDVLEERDLGDASIRIDRADYGDTNIILREDGAVGALEVGGSSVDFGRATADGRTETCELFERLLGDTVKVINKNPEPRDYERIVSP